MSKIRTYAKYAEKREDGSTIYWRTGQGSHRHASAYCANSKRAIGSGDVFTIPADEADGWAPCADCCTEADVTAAAKLAAEKADAQCANSGIVHQGSGRLYSKCRDCGKEGKVNRATGKIRAHKPQA